jgi:hypothetical protein
MKFIGNVLGHTLASWEQEKNKKTTHPPPNTPKLKRKKLSPPSLHIDCMKFLFPKWFVTIFNLDWYLHYKLGLLTGMRAAPRASLVWGSQPQKLVKVS